MFETVAVYVQWLKVLKFHKIVYKIIQSIKQEESARELCQLTECF